MILPCTQTVIENITNNIKPIIATTLCDWSVYSNLWTIKQGL